VKRILHIACFVLSASGWLPSASAQSAGASASGPQPTSSTGERFAEIWAAAVEIWNYPLVTVAEGPITVGKIVSGLLLLFIGYVLSRMIARLFGTRFLPRMKVTPSAAAALQSVLFYLLVVIFGIIALRVVNIPLTAFTLLGGALALGVGFGSQNIINNFISGLILLVERPIKVGDLIQLDDLYGNVEHIGARSTRIRTGSHLEIIVPNSSFLENNVVNLTLSDDRIRTVVKVGVIYGSPTREAARLMAKAATDHGQVLAKPEPIVLFTDFADNSLNFEIHFWIKMRTMMERLRIESDVRYMIDQAFREAGLVIAFPQRDVHLDTAAPLEVRLLSDPGEPTDSAASHQTGAA
jgi:small-conductance mechanosensitive channel